MTIGLSREKDAKIRQLEGEARRLRLQAERDARDARAMRADTRKLHARYQLYVAMWCFIAVAGWLLAIIAIWPDAGSPN